MGASAAFQSIEKLDAQVARAEIRENTIMALSFAMAELLKDSEIVNTSPTLDQYAEPSLAETMHSRAACTKPG